MKNPNDARVRAKAEATSFAGPYTREDGFLGYNEICEEKQQYKKWTLMWDDEQVYYRSI